MTSPSLKINLAGLELESPILTGSGTFGYGLEYLPIIDADDLGALVVTGTTWEPRPGNPPPRIWETPSGILNAIGLENPGVNVFIQKKLPQIVSYDLPIIVNVAGNTLDEYAQVIRELEKAPGIAAYELNISCPNVRQGGMAFGTDGHTAAAVTMAAKSVATRPIIVKLSPNVTDIAAIALAVEEAGADALSLVNTFLGMAIDIDKRRPVLGNQMGGLSGPAIRPIALRMVWQVSQAVTIPVIGMGGIDSWQAALEFIMAGATAIAVGTAFFINPYVAKEIRQGLLSYMEREHFTSIDQLVGIAWQ